MTKSNDKPHIHRAQPYDGDGWLCYVRGDDRRQVIAFGATPSDAFDEWVCLNYEHPVAHAAMGYE